MGFPGHLAKGNPEFPWNGNADSLHLLLQIVSWNSDMNVLGLITVLAWASLSVQSAPLSENAQIVGKIFYLPDYNILTEITGGHDIFNLTAVQQCFLTTEVHDNHNILNWYKDNHSLYKSLSIGAGLSLKIFSLKLTMESLYKTYRIGRTPKSRVHPWITVATNK